MSRIHEERKDFYNTREGVLTSTSNIRSIPTHSQNIEKEKTEKPLFGQQTYVGDTGFRTLDLIKQPSGRNIVPASATQLHAMPHLVTNYMTVPLSQGRGQHAFPSHIPVGVRAATAPPRASVTSQRLPTLKPTNIPSQIQLPLAPLSGLPVLPPSVVSNNRTGSPTVSSHGLTSDSRLESRTHISDPHNALRGNIQATSHNTTIQVIASGSQVHLPTTLLSSKSSAFNSSPNMLKIGVSSHSNVSSVTPMAAPAFKVGIGKTYPGSSSFIIPATSTKPEEHRSVSSFSRFTAPHSVTLHTTHHIQNLTVTTTVSNNQPLTTTLNSDIRPHATNMSVPYAAAYVFHEIGSQISVHNFPHQLVRPPATSGTALPLFTVDSPHGVPNVPVVSIAVTKGHILTTESDATRSEPLTIQNTGTFNFQNLYPNLQTNNLSAAFATSTSSNTEMSTRPGILRKRAAEGTTTLFPVQPTEKERISVPLKVERSGSLPTRLLSPPKLTSDKPEVMKPINHSIQSITSDVKSPPPVTSTTEKPNVVTVSNSIVVTTVKLTTSAPPTLANTATILDIANNLPEASPKKKPRKQHIITTEDKYGTIPMNSNCGTDEDEEFLKANETMKDITPPKLVPVNQQPTTSHPNSAMKQLYPPTQASTDLKLDLKSETKMEVNDTSQRNGLITPNSENKSNDAMKYFLFRRRPQFGITNDCKINTKATHNHFYRYSDVRVKEEKKITTQERLLTPSSLESASGWRLHHLSSQLDDLVSMEKGICEEIAKCKEIIPKPQACSPTNSYRNHHEDLSEEDLQLRLLHELIQGSIQRCRCSVEQLEEAKTTMLKMLEHKPKAMETLKKYKQRTKVKKKAS